MNKQIFFQKCNSSFTQFAWNLNCWILHSKLDLQRELQERRARYLQEYRNEISRIDKITSGARAASEERKRTRELKTREMARKLRSRGKVPRKCLCFWIYFLTKWCTSIMPTMHQRLSCQHLLILRIVGMPEITRAQNVFPRRRMLLLVR